MARETVALTVAMAGIPEVDEALLSRLAKEFGWSFGRVQGIPEVARLNAGTELVAVLFSPQGLGLPWEQALKAVQEAAPLALPIVCHRFAEQIEWPEFAEAGVFHALRLPLHLSEVRQSLGFVREAEARRVARSIGDLKKLRTAVGRAAREETSPKLVAAPRA